MSVSRNGGKTHVFCWVFYIVKKLVLTLLREGKNPHSDIRHTGYRWGKVGHNGTIVGA